MWVAGYSGEFDLAVVLGGEVVSVLTEGLALGLRGKVATMR